MSDTLTMSVETCRLYVQSEIDRVKKYYIRLGYTIVQTSLYDQAEHGRIIAVGGCIVAMSEDGFSKSYNFSVPASVTGTMEIGAIPTHYLDLIYPDLSVKGVSF